MRLFFCESLSTGGMDEVTLINVLRDNLALQFPGNGPAPPHVTAQSLAATKPDRAWLIARVAQDLRGGAGLTGHNLRLQTGALQQVDPVTNRHNPAAQRPTNPIAMNAAATATRANVTARERVDETFKTLTRDERPTVVGAPPYVVPIDIRTFTMYVPFYLASMGTHTNDWELSRRYTQRVETLANKVDVGTNRRRTAAPWATVRAALEFDGPPFGNNTMHYVLVTRWKNPRYRATYTYFFDRSAMPGHLSGNNTAGPGGGPRVGTAANSDWVVDMLGNGVHVPIDVGVWGGMTFAGVTSSTFIEIYAINPFPPPQPPRPGVEGDAHRLAGGVQFGGVQFGAMAPTYVNPVDPVLGGRITTRGQRGPADPTRNLPRAGVTRSTRSMRQVLRQGPPQNTWGEVNTIPISTRPRPFAIRAALTRAGDYTRDAARRRARKIDLMQRGRPSDTNNTGDPLVKKVKSCGLGERTRAYTFLIADNSCLWGKRYGSNCRSSGRCISRETARKHTRLRGQYAEYRRVTGGGDAVLNAHTPRASQDDHDGGKEIAWRERWIGRRDVRTGAPPFGPTNHFRGT